MTDHIKQSLLEFLKRDFNFVGVRGRNVPIRTTYTVSSSCRYRAVQITQEVLTEQASFLAAPKVIGRGRETAAILVVRKQLDFGVSAASKSSLAVLLEPGSKLEYLNFGARFCRRE